MNNDYQITKDIDAMARTIWGEARGETEDGRLAVGHVIKNRADRGGWWGNTIYEVCHKPWQFSCWNDNDPNRYKMLRLDADNEMFVECIWTALSVVLGKHPDNTSGSCHYHVVGLTPDWSEGKTSIGRIGHHEFFNDIE